MQLCNRAELNSENITPKEVIECLVCDKMDGGFAILNDDEFASSVTTVEKDQFVTKKPTISDSEAETMLSKCIDWFQIQ